MSAAARKSETAASVGEEVFAAVRRDSVTGADFIDLGTTACREDAARLKSWEPPKVWRDSNPVQRIGRFRLEEMPR